MKGIEVLDEDESCIRVKVFGGECWHQWVLYALKHQWHGLENLALIPGSVGASPIQNIGAYGVEMSSCCASVNTLNLMSAEYKTFERNNCDFGYRESLFKHDRSLFVLSVEFTLQKKYKPIISYLPLARKAEALAASHKVPSAAQVLDWICEIRSSKLPDPVELPNAGSFFKNPVVSVSQFSSLSTRFPGIVAHPYNDEFKLAAGWLIDRLGLKGYCNNGVCVHAQQALVIVNKNGSGGDVINMANHIKECVFNVYGIRLEIEPRII